MRRTGVQFPSVGIPCRHRGPVPTDWSSRNQVEFSWKTSPDPCLSVSETDTWRRSPYQLTSLTYWFSILYVSLLRSRPLLRGLSGGFPDGLFHSKLEVGRTLVPRRVTSDQFTERTKSEERKEWPSVWIVLPPFPLLRTVPYSLPIGGRENLKWTSSKFSLFL